MNLYEKKLLKIISNKKYKKLDKNKNKKVKIKKKSSKNKIITNVEDKIPDKVIINSKINTEMDEESWNEEYYEPPEHTSNTNFNYIVFQPVVISYGQEDEESEHIPTFCQLAFYDGKNFNKFCNDLIL